MSSSKESEAFSKDNFPDCTVKLASDMLCDSAIADTCFKLELIAGLVVVFDTGNTDFRVVSTANVPREPLNGSEKYSVKDALSDCFAKHPKAHVHNVGHLAIANVAKRLGKWSEGTQRVLFYPASVAGTCMVFFGFLTPKSQTAINDLVHTSIARVLSLIHLVLRESSLSMRVDSTQKFVREVGHDFASNVQAIMSKIHLLKEGSIPQSLLKKRLEEIDSEIRGAHGLADQLGLTLDPNYQIRSYEDFSLPETMENAIAQVSAEAVERKLTFKPHFGQGNLRIKGDRMALQTCWVHLLMNAIKYSYGGGFVEITMVRDEDHVRVEVSNKGHPLPAGESARRIWDFGYRGTKAKELHVNGSGVGLFTVKKIVVGHQGLVNAYTREEAWTVFQVMLPLAETRRGTRNH